MIETTNDRSELVARTEAVVRLGGMLLAAGSGAYRVEQAIGQGAVAVGIERVDLLVGHDNIVISTRMGDEVHTLVRQVYGVTADASRLEVLEELADHLAPGQTAAGLEAQLDDVSDRMRAGWSARDRVLASALGCGLFSLLNDFTAGDAMVAFVAALVGARVHQHLGSRHLNRHASAAVSSLVSCVTYGAVGWLANRTGLPVLRSVSGPGFVAALLFLVPGFSLVTAMLEVVRTDYRAGLPRMADALGQVVSIVLPGWLVASVSGMRPLQGQSQLPGVWKWVGLVVVAWLGMACFASLFNATRRVIVAAASLGAISALGKALLVAVGVPNPAAAFCGALAVGLLTAVVAPRLRVPRSTLMVPASLVMVPGALLARTIYWVGEQDFAAAGRNGVEAFGAVVAVAAGLAVARILTDPEWAVARPRYAPHAFRSRSGAHVA